MQNMPRGVARIDDLCPMMSSSQVVILFSPLIQALSTLLMNYAPPLWNIVLLQCIADRLVLTVLKHRPPRLQRKGMQRKYRFRLRCHLGYNIHFSLLQYLAFILPLIPAAVTRPA